MEKQPRKVVYNSEKRLMENQVPLFSIIIPTYNRAQLLPTAIKSVIDQTHANWELIIIDDGSTDHSKAVVSDFKDSRIRYFYQAHQERSTARNRGIKEAKGKYICFMDDDDYYLANHLSTFYEELEKRGFPLIILRTGFYKKKRKAFIETAIYDEIHDINPVKFAAFKFCSACTLCVPRQYLEHNYFPSPFRNWEDTHLIIRLLTQFPFFQIPKFTYVYMNHPIMGSKTIYHFEDAEARIQNNVDAIQDLFQRYGELVNPYLPSNTKEYLVCEKYLGHANGAVVNKKISLAFKLMWKSIRFNKKGWFIIGYLKLAIKIPFLFLFHLLSPKRKETKHYH